MGIDVIGQILEIEKGIDRNVITKLDKVTEEGIDIMTKTEIEIISKVGETIEMEIDTGVIFV